MLEYIALMTLEAGEEKTDHRQKLCLRDRKSGKKKKKKKKNLSFEKILNGLYYKNQFQSLRSKNETFQTHIYSK